jgi:hypothetical protein
LAEGVAEIPTGLLEIGAGQLSQAGATANQPAATAPAATAPQPAPFTPPPAAETVVVEEVFGDPTTAAAEPVAAAAPAFDPSQDFEVVQEPSETIVTEPPAAPKIFRGVSPDVDYSSGDQFWSESREVAENYAGQTGTEGTIDEATPETLPKNLYTATDKPTLKDELELKNEPFAPEFDAEAKTVLQARGFEGIRYESGTDLGGEQAAEFHVFGKPKQQAAQQPAPMPVQEAALRLIKKTDKAPANTSKWPSPTTEGAEVVFSPYGPEGSGFYERPATSPAEQTTSAVRIAELEDAYNKSKKKLDDLGPEPPKPSPERRTFGAGGRAAASPESVAAYDLGVKAYNSYRRKYTAAKKAEVEASNSLFFERQKLEDQQAAQQDTPAKRSRTRIKNMTAQSGAIDLSIVEDLVEYGKTVYRAGMSFGKWAGQMVKEFGQGIASFLRQAFDRIVQAYKDSPYSDTTGAVGDVRPKAKPRQFEQKAAQAPGISEEARAQMGDDPYVPITLKGTAEEAKAWLAQNGVDAAERRILELNSDEITPTPLDFGIGLELTANLSATGQHSRAAAVVRTMSRRATSIGQTISVLAMLARLTPDGIVFYANQLIEQYINEMPEGIKARVRTAQTQVAEIEKGVAEDRKNVANTTIINGEHGGEKIATKVRRRIPDKGKSQGALTSVRSVLMSKATKAEAIKQIAEILQGAGISQSEAQSLANTIASRFYKVIEEARKGRAAALKPKSGKARISFDKLMSKLTEGKVSDEDLISTLAVIAGVPAMTPEMRKQWQELARQYQEATDPDVKMVLAGRIFEEAHSILPADFWAKLRAISYLSMLFAPKTWIRNLGGNQIQFIANVGKDTVIDGAVDPLVSVFTGKRSTSGVYVGKRFSALLTPIWDVKKGYDWNKKQNPQASFSENMKAGIEHLRVLSKLTTQNKFDITDVRDAGRRMFSSKFMRAWEAGLSIALGGGDRGFWMAQFRTSMAQQEAAAKRNGEWTGQPTPEMVETAFAEAAYAIYQNPNFVSKGLNWVRKGLNWIFSAGRTTQFGVGTSLMAFTQVPGSIFLRAFVEWSPLGTINALYQSMGGVLYAKSGGRYGVKFDQRKFNNAFTQAILGTGVYAAGYWLYAMGIVTASREEDEDLEAMRRTLGGGGYRINVSALKRMLLSGNFFDRQETEEPDFIMTYDWAQPMAIAVAAGAEYAAQSERATREGLRKKLLGTNGTLAISLKAGAKSLEEQPLLSGLSSFAKTWGYSGLVEAVYGTIANIPAMFVPQLVRQASQLQDNTVRETRGDRGMLQAFTKIASQTPFVQDTAPPRFDILGQAMERYQYGGNTFFNVLANPGMVSRVKEVPALSEVARLMNVTGETRQIPRLVERTADINGQSVELTNEQISAYQYYLGNYTMSMFNWRMASPRYARLPDTEKVKLLAQDLEDVNAATKSALFGHDVRRLTRRQRVMRANLVNSPLGQSMPPR